MVDPLLRRGAVVELCGRAWSADGVVVGVDDPDLLSQLGIGCGPSRTRRGALDPGVVRGTLDLDELTQSLHLEGGGVVSDELEATHQRVSPAKYFAARCKISRSVASFVVSTSNSLTLASSRAIVSSGAS